MDKREFLAAMTRLRACYPQRVNDAEHWMAMVARYHDELVGHDPTLLAGVLDGAWRHCPAFFPSLGEIEELYLQAVKRRASNVAGLLTESNGPDAMSEESRRAIDALAKQWAMPEPQKTEAQVEAARRRGAAP